MIAAVSQETAVAVIAAAGIVLGFVVLAIVGWIFWRAAKRDRAEEEARRNGDIADRDLPG